jgi:hypothetical protein
MITASEALKITRDSIASDERFADVWKEINAKIYEAALDQKGYIEFLFDSDIVAGWIANRIDLFGFTTLKPERNGVKWAQFYTGQDVPLEKENGKYKLTIIWAGNA